MNKIVTESRKVPLRKSRSTMLKDYQNYMMVYSDQYYIAEKDQILRFLKKYIEYCPHLRVLSVNEICLKFDVLMQTRNLMY